MNNLSLPNTRVSASKYTLLCNSRNCRAKLSGFAWVTVCSHVFCDQHGSERLSRIPTICPACSSMLSGKLDVLRTELAPSEQYKAMALVNQERLLMEYNMSRAGGQAIQMEKFMIQQKQTRELEMNALQGEIESLKKMLEEYKRKYGEVLEQLKERNKQYKKLQGLLDSLRLHTLGPEDATANTFTTGLINQPSFHSSPLFAAAEGDRFFLQGPETTNNFFQFSTPTHDRTNSFVLKH